MVAFGELVAMLKYGTMDFVGQKQAYDLHSYIIWLAGLLGFIYGLYMQRFLYTFYFIAGGTGLAVLLCFPSWPMWNRNPVQWLEPAEEEDEEEDEDEKAKQKAKEKEKEKKDKAKEKQPTSGRKGGKKD
mmetsp:Transcript_30528/g.65759  ORF Transcript_30528/g.65759 Transcript_30528/m.65759 type:complete len:129 (-) Transcript_30528:39-425(-)|eukprot:CAMPEP_0206464838 /NCGR_PEP_ID=MMETSP0324_2-20121206/27456_1 /ASSEMBLY_ACC=CAM_ASM_000836 /TAXON_ID=2866 /ORGANISM="Crypthecodinium cohnii, Strain Seligo" /LENGTH=128 /DNA_ID=CAMNT_0053937549 /DNA_START=281 /DNA_END=667 /DNA_ORIENTATION=-